MPYRYSDYVKSQNEQFQAALRRQEQYGYPTPKTAAAAPVAARPIVQPSGPQPSDIARARLLAEMHSAPRLLDTFGNVKPSHDFATFCRERR